MHQTSRLIAGTRSFVLLYLSLVAASSAATLSVAHRGNSSRAPENTLASFLECRSVADLVEFDVRMTLDGQWVVMHDATVNRTTNGSGAVAQMTYEQIRALDAGSWFAPRFAGQPVPSMAEAIQTILDAGMTPFIEPKSGSATSFVAELQRLGTTSNVLVQSFDWPLLGQIHALDPSIRLAALADGNVTPDKLDQIQAVGATVANWTRSNTIPPFLEMVHARGMEMYSYIINDRATIDSMVAMGVDGIGTDFPDRVWRATHQASVVDRHIFYNNSRFDGLTPQATTGDDAAIATDKVALLPGTTAAFSNYSSYSRGINGVMIDIENLRGVPTAADFTFRMGNSFDLTSWTPAPAPVEISVRMEGGTDGSDRISVIWPDGAIANQWLEVTVLPSTETGLEMPDTFYFGNAIAESGNNPLDAGVTVSDEVAARNNGYLGSVVPIPISNRWDFNRDGSVSVSDQVLARNNRTTILSRLKLITPRHVLAPTAMRDVQFSPVPEPGSAVLMSTGLFGSMILIRRARRSSGRSPREFGTAVRSADRHYAGLL